VPLDSLRLPASPPFHRFGPPQAARALLNSKTMAYQLRVSHLPLPPAARPSIDPSIPLPVSGGPQTLSPKFARSHSSRKFLATRPLQLAVAQLRRRLVRRLPLCLFSVAPVHPLKVLVPEPSVPSPQQQNLLPSAPLSPVCFSPSQPSSW